MLDARKDVLERLKQALGALLVGPVGSQHFNGEQVALGVNEHMPLSAKDFFSGVVALLGTTNRAGFDGLAIDDGEASLRVTPGSFSRFSTQGRQDLIPNACVAP